MNVEVQLQLKQDPNLSRYLREHGEWYKVLNRDPSQIQALERAMKTDYKLRPLDKMGDFAEKMQLINMFLNLLR